MPGPNRRRYILSPTTLVLAGTVAVLLYVRHQSETAAIARWPVPLLIEARGHDRQWQFTYAGADGLLGSDDDVVTTRHFRIPTGVTAHLQLRSDDYIYVFSCPDLDLREIAVPELDFFLQHHTGQRGTHDLAMDPICGFRLPPGENMGSLQIVSKSNFGSWIADLMESE